MRVLKFAMFGVGLAIAAPVSAADITVLRGNETELVRGSTAGPTILRGGNTMRVNPPKEAAPARTVHAGETLWLVAKKEPVAACFLTRKGYAGRRVIRCTQARY